MNLIELIESYIIFLITECYLSISLHPQSKETLITFSRLMRFNLHDNSYCTYIKSVPEGRERCLKQQKKVFQKCTDIKDGFCGICHAGVFEYVYPISNGESITGFISVSGYSCEGGVKKLDASVNDLGYSGKLFCGAIHHCALRMLISTRLIRLCFRLSECLNYLTKKKK